MKIIKKEKLNTEMKIKLHLLFFIILSNCFFSQNFKNYYLTTDLVTFKNPILVVPDVTKVGIFIMENDDYNNEKDIRKLFKQKKAFLFDTDTFSYASYTDRKNLGYKEDEYDYSYRKEEGQTIILKLNEKIKSFYVNFIKLSYYNRIDASAHARYPYISDADNYVIVLVPHAETNLL